MSLYKQKKKGGPWYYTFYVDRQRYSGNTEEKEKGRAKTREAIERAKVVEGKIPPGMRKCPILSDYADGFLKALEEQTKAGHKAKNTLRDYRYGADLLKDTKLWSMKLDAIDSVTVETVRFKSWAMGNSALRTLRRILHQAEDARLIYRAPKFKLFEDRTRTTVIEPWLEELMLAEAKEPLRTVLIIMLDSFMRPFEVVAIRWEDVRWDRREIWIPDSKSPSGKRFVGMTSRITSTLQSRKHGSKSPWVFPAKRLVGPAPLGHMWATSLGKMWGAMKAKIIAQVRAKDPEWQWPDDLVLYSSRHTGITNYSEQVGGNQMKVARAAGHADLKTTSRYVHPASDQAQTMDKVVEFRKRRA